MGKQIHNVNGWWLRYHPYFVAQLQDLICEVERHKSKNSLTYREKTATKRLLAIKRLIFKNIPANPASDEFCGGGALGESRRFWRRAKFYQQYRLFFRYRESVKIIIYAWVNDENTKRAYGSQRDAYRVFAKMLNTGNPPDDWDALMTVVLDEAPMEPDDIAGD